MTQETKPGAELPDSIRVPLHKLWADAGYLVGRAKQGDTEFAVHNIKARCDEIERAIRAAIEANRVEPTKQALDAEFERGRRQGITQVYDAQLASQPSEANRVEAPIDMVLHCPKCGMQHVDHAEPAVEHDFGAVEFAAWDNPPHRSHLCHGCGQIWRPADVPTNGVAAVKTKGKADSEALGPAGVSTWPDAETGNMSIPLGLEPNTALLVTHFASVLAQKLFKAQEEYGYGIGWMRSDWMAECRAQLIEHVAKGDPLDVAAYCAFLWYHNETTATPASPPAEPVGWMTPGYPQMVTDEWKRENLDNFPWAKDYTMPLYAGVPPPSALAEQTETPADEKIKAWNEVLGAFGILLCSVDKTSGRKGLDEQMAFLREIFDELPNLRSAAAALVSAPKGEG